MASQSNDIDVSVYLARPAEGEECPMEFEGVNYISFVSAETYGIPALISDEKIKDEGLPAKVLYVCPANISCMEATRCR